MTGPTTTAVATPPTARTRRAPVDRTVLVLTLRVLLGRKRGLLFLALPALVLLLAVLLRWAGEADQDTTIILLGTFAIGTVLPLLALVAGTGVIGPEIDDGSIVYLLAKPVPRLRIVVSKLLVAIGCMIVFGAVPIFVAGLIMSSTERGIAVGFGIGAVLAGIGYSCVFLLLAIVSRNAVVFGLVYALLWETVVGGFVPGAQTLSIQQWALAVSRSIVDVALPTATVDLAVAVPGLVIVTVLATWFATERLRSLSMTGEE